MDTQEIITSMIDKIVSGDNTAAKDDFEGIIASKMQDAIELKKQEIAQSVYGKGIEVQAEDEPSEEEISDESETA